MRGQSLAGRVFDRAQASPTMTACARWLSIAKMPSRSRAGVADERAFASRSAVGNPKQTEEAHHMVDAQAARMRSAARTGS